jgi:hypothetical protein
MTTNTSFRNSIAAILANPAAVARTAINLLEAESNGAVRLVDASGPFPFNMEAACSMAAAGIIKAAALNHKQYPSAAQTMQDLYLHMSDRDYLNRFATPAQTTLTVVLGLGELQNKVIDDPSSPGVKKLTIPRQTEFNVGGYALTMQYPIDIRILPHGGISATFDVSQPSPIYSLPTNLIRASIGTIQMQDYLTLQIPIYQMQLTSTNAALNAMTGFSKQFSFPDNFYYCRAYIQATGSNTWTEIRTTHTDQVYDPRVPTVVLQVLNNALSVTVPQVYFNTGIIQDSIRVDIYTTKGTLELSLASYLPAAFSAVYRDLDTTNQLLYSAPLTTFSALAIFGQVALSGGTLGLSFNQLQQQVIENAKSVNGVPITNAQLTTYLSDAGYSLVTDLDIITNRLFLATRDIPAPTDGSTLTGAGCAVQMYASTLNDLASLATVSDNHVRITLLPNTIYQSVGGVLSIVNNAMVQTWLNPSLTSADALANIINSGSYLFSPFYYVLDVSTAEFQIRPYRLDAPSVTSKYLFQDNPQTLIQATGASYAIGLNPSGSGYILAIQLATSPTWANLTLDQINVQLSYVIPGGVAREYINGVLQLDGTGAPAGGVYTYHFAINTAFDIDTNNNLILTPSLNPMGLLTTFDVCYVVKNQMPVGATRSDIDSIINATLFTNYDPNGVYLGVTQERYTIEFGEALINLWQRSRSVVDSQVFRTYPADVPAVYTQTEYARDANGNIKLVFNTATNTFTYTLTHHIGDPVLDSLNNPTYLHRRGDIVLDAYGNPTVIGGARGILREFDMFLIDGSYFFATDPTSVNYLATVVDLVQEWVTGDLVNFQALCIENTRIYFYPKSSVGTTNVVLPGGVTATVATNQAITINYVVSATTYANENLRSNMTATSITTLATALQALTISLSDIESQLNIAMSGDALSVDVQGFMNNQYSIVTLADQSMQPAIGKQLVALSNLTLQVQDSVTVNFINIDASATA